MRTTTEVIRVDDGADSFVVKNGGIVFQSIHYTPARTSKEDR